MAHRPFTQERPSYRAQRFAQIVKEDLIELIRGLKDPRLENVVFLTITSVEVNPDLKHGTVKFTLGQEEQKEAKPVEEALNHAANFLRHQLMIRLETKVTPHLVFKYDHGLENSMQIDALLKQIKHDDDGNEND